MPYVENNRQGIKYKVIGYVGSDKTHETYVTQNKRYNRHWIVHLPKQGGKPIYNVPDMKIEDIKPHGKKVGTVSEVVISWSGMTMQKNKQAA